MPPVGRQEIGFAARGVASMLPPRRELVYYTGLGALAGVGLVEWPVAVAIGAGTAVARRAARDEQRRSAQMSQRAAGTADRSEGEEDEGAVRQRAGARPTRRSTSAP
jgi:hypothetical protein